MSTNASVSSNQADGASSVLALANVMKGSTQPVTAAGIKLVMASAKNVTIPLSGGLTFTCNGTAIPQLTSVCSSWAALGTIQAGEVGNGDQRQGVQLHAAVLTARRAAEAGVVHR